MGNNRHMYWVAAVVFGVGGAALLALAFTATPDTVGYEVAKNLSEFLIVTLLGGLLAFVLGEHQRRREEWRQERDAHNDAVRQLNAELTAAYRAVKTARRRLRAAVGPLRRGEELPVDEYDAQVAVVNEAQLDIEGLVDRLEAIDDARLERTELKGHLRAAEKYLSALVKEYNRKRVVLNAKRVAAADLKRLRGFLGRTKANDELTGDFKDSFSRPVHAAQKAFTEALLAPYPRA